MKRIYLIMAVRGGVKDSDRQYMERLEVEGNLVHYPPRDAPQDDPTGAEICRVHRQAMIEADEVHVIWDVESKGSHFDLGMAYALGKKIVPAGYAQPITDGKSYWKAVIAPCSPAQRSGDGNG